MKKSEANIEDLRNQTVSWGTHRPDDLIPKFMAVLKEYGKEAYDKYVSENPEVEDWKTLDDETKGWVVDELFDLLDGIAPEDCYFGAHPGDGADFGFWQVDESKKNEEVIVDLTLPEAKKIYADVHKNHWDKSKFGKVMGSCLEYEDVSELIDYLIGVYDPGIRDRLDEDDELMRLCFILLDEWREEHEPTESKKNEAKYDGPVTLYGSTRYDDAEEAQKFLDGISGGQVKVSKDRNGDMLIVSIAGSDEDIDAFLEVYKDNYDNFETDCDANVMGWTSPGDLPYLTVQGRKELTGESKKSEGLADGGKDIYILDLTRIDAEGDEEGLDDMQAAQDFYDEDEAIQAAKDLADSYKDDDDVVQVTVLWAQEKPNGDIVDDWFDIFTASSSDSATTAKYRETAGYAKTDGLDYYAKGGKSEAKESEGNYQDWISFAYTMYASRLRTLARKLVSFGFDVEDDVNVKDENKNDKSAEYILYAKKDGKTYEINVDIYEGKHTTITIKADNKVVVQGEGSSFASALATIDANDFNIGEAKKSESHKTKEKLSSGDYTKYWNIDHYAAKAAGWTWNDEQECYEDKDGNEVDWDSYDAVMIDPIEFGGHTYKQVNVWGDGTVEFQDESGESLNWADFDAELVSKVYAAIGGVVNESKKSMGRDQFIKDVLELADAEEQEYYRDELVSFAKDYYDHGETSVDKVLSDYFADTNESKKSEAMQNEGWTGGFGSRQEILDLMDGGILNKDWNLEKRFGNWGCYVNQNTGRPIVLQMLIEPDNDHGWAYKPVTSDMGPYGINIQAAKWLKPRLEKWVEENPDKSKDVSDYEWEWIEKCLGKAAATKSKKDIAASLVKGDKVKLIDTVANGAVVTFIEMMAPGKMRILHNGREMSCKTSYIDRKVDATAESKKSESLTLKQKELKNMARYGEATDITTISDAEAKELKKKGIETVGISRGAYGMNGALLRDNEGNKYVITARSSNLFYFI